MEGSRIIVVCGAAGRMGQAIVRAVLARRSEGVLMGAGVEISGHPLVGRKLAEWMGEPEAGSSRMVDRMSEALPASVAIDFSHPSALSDNLEACRMAATPLVVGTTGLGTTEQTRIERAARFIPIVLSPNMSVGVNVLFRLVETAARALGREFEVEILEAHHNQKKDAPSGTAMRLGEVAASALGGTLADAANFHREGLTGPRRSGEIGMQTLRGGDTPGEHTVYFFGQGERIELTHRALTRDIFAQGAVRAALWAVGKPAGLYSMDHVLGLASA